VSDFARRLVRWQARHGRHDLPWQGTRDAYRIWLSEIMLQQTQVATVIPYYGRFLARFPDVESLAAAELDDVLALWSGLGYYSRARNLHAAARTVMKDHDGRFPREREALASLPGVGRSTAAAIAVFAFGAREAILDGNVKRVLSRQFAVRGYPGEARVEARLWALAESLLPERNAARYTQALMDLGAAVCTRARPACAECPVSASCKARARGKVAAYPSPRPRKPLPVRNATMLLLVDRGELLLEKRPPTGVWGGLWCLPEMPENADPREYCERRFGLRVADSRRLAPLRHGFTHFTLDIVPVVCPVSARAPRLSEPGRLWVAREDAAQAAVPAVVRKLLERTDV